MAIKRRASGTFTDIAAIKRRAGGAWVVPTIAKRSSGGAWVDLLPSGPGVSITDQTITQVGDTGARSVAGIGYTAAGSVTSRQGGPGAITTIGTWLVYGAASDYEIRATVLSGITPQIVFSDVVDAWLSLSVDRAWNLRDNDSAPGGVSSVLLIEIRAAGGAVIDSATITLSATYEV